jgi:cytochrome c5
MNDHTDTGGDMSHSPTRSLGLLLAMAVGLVACVQTNLDAPSTEVAARGDLDGASLYANNCARCHGVDATGSSSGPSFLLDVYVPSHHADESFQMAAARGVQPHHWNFGAMPPVGTENGLSRDDVAAIVTHVRSLQRLAGLIQ